jgi:hypothetical protein
MLQKCTCKPGSQQPDLCITQDTIAARWGSYLLAYMHECRGTPCVWLQVPGVGCSYGEGMTHEQTLGHGSTSLWPTHCLATGRCW